MDIPAPKVSPGMSLAAVMLTVALLVHCLVHLPTLADMVLAWGSSQTYSHCILVVPIVGFLIWRRREALADVAARPAARGLLWLALILLIGVLADWAAVQVGRHLAFVAAIPIISYVVLGNAVFKRIAFPLLFLLFAVPVGDEVVPFLQDVTADITVGVLRLVGLPVYREGLYFDIPSGRFEVAKACSGVRYLIASLAIGALYAFETRQSGRERALILLLALLVPILANGVRAVGIVMLAHYSDMRLAVGVDHFIYGWLFFGAVILILYWLVSKIPVRTPPRVGRTGRGDATAVTGGEVSVAKFLFVLIGISLLTGAARLSQHRDTLMEAIPEEVSLPAAAPGWTGLIAAVDEWSPSMGNSDFTLRGAYDGRGATIELRVVGFWGQSQGKELISTENRIAAGSGVEILSDAAYNSGLEVPARVREALIRVDREERLLWYWFDIGGELSTSAAETKLLQLWDQLLGRPGTNAVIIVSTAIAGNRESARSEMERFLREHATAISRCLHGGTATSHECRSASPESSWR